MIGPNCSWTWQLKRIDDLVKDVGMIGFERIVEEKNGTVRIENAFEEFCCEVLR